MDFLKKYWYILVPLFFIIPLVFASIFGPTGTTPEDIVIDENTGIVYAVNSGDNTVTKTYPNGTKDVLATVGLAPKGIALDSAGNIYTANSGSNTVSKVTPAGIVTTYGTTGGTPVALVFDGFGNLFVANSSTNNISKILSDGSSSIFATTGTTPVDIALSSTSDLYTANYGSNNVSKITITGTSTILGSTGIAPVSISVDINENVYTSNSQSGTVTKLTQSGVSTILGVMGVSTGKLALDSHGGIFVTAPDKNEVIKITHSGIFRVYGSTGAYPYAIAINSAGDVYTANKNSNNITIIAANGDTSFWGSKIVGFDPDIPNFVAVDSHNNTYITSQGGVLARFTSAGLYEVFASVGTNPQNLLIDSSDTIFVVNEGDKTVSKVTSSGVSSVLGTTGKGPKGIARDSAGNIYVANSTDRDVTKITPAGVSTILGKKNDTGQNPLTLVVSSVGDVYTADFGSNRITKITQAGVATNFATTGAGPRIAIDSNGNLYTANETANTVTKVTPAGVTTLNFASTGLTPVAIAIDSADNVYTLNRGSHDITKITPAGISSSIALTGKYPKSFVFHNRSTTSFHVASEDNSVLCVDTYYLASRPNAPTLTRGNGQVILNWTEPSLNSGPAISDYIVEYKQTGTRIWNTFNDGISSNTTATVTGLTNGVSYDFRIIATTTVDNTSPSASSTMIPATIPNAPRRLSGTPSNEKIDVTYYLDNDGGLPVNYFTVTMNPGNMVATTTATSTSFTGLTNGVPYTFNVFATNDVGAGPVSIDSLPITPSASAMAVRNLTGGRDDKAVYLYFDAPLDSESDIDDYKIEYKLSSDSSWTVWDDGVNTLTTVHVTGLTNGTHYDFRVTAHNITPRYGEPTYINDDIPGTVPGKPTITSIVPGNTRATIYFSAPSDTGGFPITNYTALSDPLGRTVSGTSSPLIVNSLANNVPYTFTMTASNINGVSASSDVFGPVTPSADLTVPDAPTNVTAVAGDGKAYISFTTPANNGGSPILSYKATSSPGGITAESDETDFQITGLTNGTTYTFTVTATNSVGEGPASTQSNAVMPIGKPSVPRNVQSVGGNERATLYWTIPQNDGGSAIQNYAVEYRELGQVDWETVSHPTSPITTIEIQNLTNDIVYEFRVAAINGAGSGDFSNIVQLTPRKGGSIGVELKGTSTLSEEIVQEKSPGTELIPTTPIENQTQPKTLSKHWFKQFFINLRFGDTHPEVRRLQQFLNSHGYTITITGPGSPGNETSYFGIFTRSALIKYQNDNADKIIYPIGVQSGTGNLYESTRDFINKHLQSEE